MGTTAMHPCTGILRKQTASANLLFQRNLVHLIAMCGQALGGVELAMTFCTQIAQMVKEVFSTGYLQLL
jgi:hypothetical protein